MQRDLFCPVIGCVDALGLTGRATKAIKHLSNKVDWLLATRLVPPTPHAVADKPPHGLLQP
jgi:hypothetical protein